MTDPVLRRLASKIPSPARARLRTVAAHVRPARPLWPPPDAAKRAHLRSLLLERELSVFIESGTYKGDTVESLRHDVDRVISIEVEPSLYRAAVERFRNLPTVEIVLGDAAELLPGIVAAADVAFLLWLDGHYSGGETGSGAEVEPALLILDRLAEVGVPRGSVWLWTTCDSLGLKRAGPLSNR